MIRRILLAMVAFLAPVLPAAAQSATDSGPSLLWVWGWILVAGILVFIIGTSLGVQGRR